MASTIRARTLFCFLIIASLFSNAMGAGMCMLFCTKRLCCNETSVLPKKLVRTLKASCPMQAGITCCKAEAKAAKIETPHCAICGIAIPVLPKPCCDWIIKKHYPVGIFSSPIHLSADSFIATLPIAPIDLTTFEADPKLVRLVVSDRAPPQPWFECSAPRGPPIA